MTDAEAARPDRSWPRVAGLFVVVLATSAFVNPGVVIGVPLLLLLALFGFGNLLAAVVAGLLMLVVAGGRSGLWEGLWYVERAWTLVLGGWFVALTLLAPTWRLTSRALGAVFGTIAVTSAVLVVSTDAWATLDAEVTRSMQSDMDATLQALTLIGGQGGPSEEMITLARDIGALQVLVFPGLLVIQSLAALAVAWWAWGKLVGRGEHGVGPLRDFRFNDHLVWLLIAGLVLVLTQSGDAATRLGSNAVVVMGALYALRGVAVFAFVSGGVSVLQYVVFVMLFVLVPPIILGTAALVGVGDTWLDLRARAAKKAV